MQAQGKSTSDPPTTIGKATLDLAKYCSEQTTTQNAMLPITFKVGGTTTGYLKMTVTAVFLADADGDGLTEVSGMTGMTSEQGSGREQDLDGERHAPLLACWCAGLFVRRAVGLPMPSACTFTLSPSKSMQSTAAQAHGMTTCSSAPALKPFAVPRRLVHALIGRLTDACMRVPSPWSTGFHDDEHGRGSKKAAGSRNSNKADEDSSPTAAGAGSSRPRSSGAAKKALPTTVEEDDDTDDDAPIPPPKSRGPAGASGRKAPVPAPEPAGDDEDDNPFAKKAARPPPPRKAPPPKKWADDEDISPLSSDVSVSRLPPAGPYTLACA